MYDYIRGRLVSKKPTEVVIDAGGVGYRFYVPFSTFENLPAQGEVTLLAHLHVREDEMRLYGFYSSEERDLFDLLTSVRGVGPGTAIGVLSGISVEDFKRAIAVEDVGSLQEIKGVGKKIAQRLILELKGVLPQLESGSGEKTAGATGVARDAIAALVRLGYQPPAAQAAVNAAAQRLGNDAALEALIRESLKRPQS